MVCVETHGRVSVKQDFSFFAKKKKPSLLEEKKGTDISVPFLCIRHHSPTLGIMPRKPARV
jgi:hypothetical protein